MLLLCSMALAGEITVHFETHQAGPAAVTFHGVEDGDTIHLLLPGEDGQPVAAFETVVSFDAETQQVQFDAEIHGLQASRRGPKRSWLASPQVRTHDGQEALFEMGWGEEFLRVRLLSDFSD